MLGHHVGPVFKNIPKFAVKTEVHEGEFVDTVGVIALGLILGINEFWVI